MDTMSNYYKRRKTEKMRNKKYERYKRDTYKNDWRYYKGGKKRTRTRNRTRNYKYYNIYYIQNIYYIYNQCNI